MRQFNFVNRLNLKIHGSIQINKKPIKQFDVMINNDDKLNALEGVFDVLDSSDSISKIPNAHYDVIN